MPRVVLYTRRGCHLCDVARTTLEGVRERHAFQLDEVDVDATDELTRDYGYRVPVVEVDGVEAFEVEVPVADLEALVRGR